MSKRLLKREYWNVAIRKKWGEGVLKNDSYNIPFKVIKNGKGFWVADPFLIEKNNLIYIFAEIFVYKLGRGVIGYTIWNEKNKSINGWKIIIKEEYHLSFPFIYEDLDEIYIIPESNNINQITRYRAVSFPDIWEKEVLYEGRKCVDTVLYQTEKQWKGYTFDITEGHHNGKGYTFRIINDRIIFDTEVYDDTLKTARLGGGFVMTKKGLLRVSQKCDKCYGEAVIFTSFNENNKMHNEEVMRLYCKDVILVHDIKPKGLHTYNRSKNYEIIDLKSYRFSLFEWIYKICRLMRKKFKGV